MRVCSVKQRFLVCPLALRLPYGQGGSRLPPAPWAVVLCWWSLELELKTKRALVWGEGGWGLKRPRVHWPHYPNFRQLGRDPARAHLRKGTNLDSGSCIHESETLLGKSSSAPMRVCSGKQRFPVSHQGLCLPQGQGISGLPLAPWALVHCRSSLELETNSKRALLWGEGRWGLKGPCVHWPQHPNLSGREGPP